MKNINKTHLYIHITLLSVLFCQTIKSQQSPTQYIVKEGETISQIAQKYKVTPKDIYTLNPKAINGISKNDTLLLPQSLIKVTPVSSVTLSKKNEISNNEFVYVVQSKETKFGLAKILNISITSLEEQNPHIVNGLQSGHIIKVNNASPEGIRLLNNRKNEIQYSSLEDYLVQPKETLYGISKKYDITVDQLVALNQSVLQGILKSGQTIKVPVLSKNSFETYTVSPGETKFGLSRKFGVSIDELEQQNPQIIEMLQAGHVLKIPNKLSSSKTIVNSIQQAAVSPQKNQKLDSEKPKENLAKPTENIQNTIVEDKDKKYVDYTIKQGETLFGLSKKAGMKIDDFISLNPLLAEKVQSGMVIKMPKESPSNVNDKSNQSAISTENIIPIQNNAVIKQNEKNNENIGFTSTKNNNLISKLNKRESRYITIVLPFNEEKFKLYHNASSVTDGFLKRNIDFYAGAKKGLDSLKSLGLNLQLQLIEGDKFENNSSLKNVLKKQTLQKNSVLILPYYANEIGQIAQELTKENIAILSLTTSEFNYNYANIFQAMPIARFEKEAIIDYVYKEKGNVILITDESRNNETEELLEKYPKTRVIGVSSKGVLDEEKLKKELMVNTKNWVVLNTNKNGLLLSATTVLMGESSKKDIQIAFLKEADLPTNENLSRVRLAILKAIFPTPFSKIDRQSGIFSKSEQTQEYQIGFDVIFDTGIRLCQDLNFESVIKDNQTEHSIMKFNYKKSADRPYMNQGVYLFQFETEKMIKAILSN